LPHYNVKPIVATLAPSRLLAALLVGMHGLCALLVVLMPLASTLRLTLLMIIAASLAYHLLRDVLQRLPASVSGLHLATDGTFSVRLRQSDWVPAEVLGTSFVQPWLTVLNLKLERGRFMHPVVLLPDALNHDDFRRLRVWLKWGRHGAQDAAML
jgi:toxin CptA